MCLPSFPSLPLSFSDMGMLVKTHSREKVLWTRADLANKTSFGFPGDTRLISGFLRLPYVNTMNENNAETRLKNENAKYIGTNNEKTC